MFKIEWLCIVISWVFINVIVKLLVNSLERVFKDRIDEAVKKSPIFLKFFFVEFFRILFVIFLLPTIILSKSFPRTTKSPLINHIQTTVNFLLSKKRFHKASPLMLYLV
jgi:hypothetical protein